MTCEQAGGLASFLIVQQKSRRLHRGSSCRPGPEGRPPPSARPAPPADFMAGLRLGGYFFANWSAVLLRWERWEHALGALGACIEAYCCFKPQAAKRCAPPLPPLRALLCTLAAGALRWAQGPTVSAR